MSNKEFEDQDEMDDLVLKLAKKGVPFTTDTVIIYNIPFILVKIDPEYNPNCIDFVLGWGLDKLVMSWLPADRSDVYVKGHLTADEALRYVTREESLPDYSE